MPSSQKMLPEGITAWTTAFHFPLISLIESDFFGFDVLFFGLRILGIEPRASYMLKKLSIYGAVLQPEQLKTVMGTFFGEHTYEKM